MSEKVLLIGSGGREHALAWKILKSPRVSELYWAPGNAVALKCLRAQFPMKTIALWNEASENPAELYAQLAEKAKRIGISLVVVGPDQALADGATDAFQAAGLSVFGPTKAAAKLEWSKAFAKEVMQSAGVPTAASHETHSLEETEKLLRQLSWEAPSSRARAPGWVLKADGLALGKGVEVCEDLPRAIAAARRLHSISSTLVIEERLNGREVSLFALCDGETAVVLDSARDYKTLRAHGQGPNTGGMGSLSPVPGLASDFRARMKEVVFQPMLTEMKKRGTPFAGLLYAGLMGHFEPGAEDIRVLEFNSRFGDPETQGLLPRITEDFYPWLLASATGDLRALPDSPAFTRESSVFVVAAAEGYPESPRKGDVIEGIDLHSEALFLAGVGEKDGKHVTQGGRVLGTLGFGKSPEEARENAFSAQELIRFRGKQVREDVGQ